MFDLKGLCFLQIRILDDRGLAPENMTLPSLFVWYAAALSLFVATTALSFTAKQLKM